MSGLVIEVRVDLMYVFVVFLTCVAIAREDSARVSSIVLFNDCSVCPQQHD